MMEVGADVLRDCARQSTWGTSRLCIDLTTTQEAETAFADTVRTLRAMRLGPVPVDVMDAAMTTARLLVRADERKLGAQELETVFAVTWKSVQRNPDGFTYKQLGAYTFARRRTPEERTIAEVHLLKRFDWKLHLLCGPCRFAEFLLLHVCKRRLYRVSRRQYIRCRRDIRCEALAWLVSSAELHIGVVDAAVRILRRHVHERLKCDTNRTK